VREWKIEKKSGNRRERVIADIGRRIQLRSRRAICVWVAGFGLPMTAMTAIPAILPKSIPFRSCISLPAGLK
jgi:hypothetical protein